MINTIINRHVCFIIRYSMTQIFVIQPQFTIFKVQVNDFNKNKHLVFSKQLVHHFSSDKINPLLQRIMKGEDENAQQIEKILTEINTLHQKNRQIALKLIIKKIYNGVHVIQLLDNEKFSKHIKKHPNIFIETSVFKIKHKLLHLDEVIKGLQLTSTQQYAKHLQYNSLINQINQIFVIAFQYNKKISKGTGNRSQAVLHKRFADYHFYYLSKIVRAEQKHQILKKSIQFYRSSLNKTGELIINQKNVLDTSSQSPLQQNQSQQSKTFKLNTTKQNMRMLIQSNAQIVYHLFMNVNQLAASSASNKLSSIKREAVGVQEAVFQLLPDFKKTLQYYKLLDQITIHSIYYHKVKKLALQIQYFSNIQGFKKYNTNQNGLQEFYQNNYKDFKVKCNALYKQTSEDLQQVLKTSKNVRIILELSQLLFSIKVHLLMKQKQSIDDKKFNLVLQVKKILQLIEDKQIKKKMSTKLAQLLKQVLDINSQKQLNSVSKSINLIKNKT